MNRIDRIITKNNQLRILNNPVLSGSPCQKIYFSIVKEDLEEK